jgi:hypothetical protein
VGHGKLGEEQRSILSLAAMAGAEGETDNTTVVFHNSKPYPTCRPLPLQHKNDFLHLDMWMLLYVHI